MTKTISSRDWEALSAYLDGYLSPKERQRLEDRLQRSVELKNGLEELRRTRLVLRSQPKMRAPRNFTLTPEMVGARPSSQPVGRYFPVLRLASVLASILLILVFVGDLLTVTNSQTARLNATNRMVEESAPLEPGAGEVEMPAAAPETEAYSEKALLAAPTGTAGMMMTVPNEGIQGTPAPPAALAQPSGGGGPTSEEQAADTTELALPAEAPLPTMELMPAPTQTPVPAVPVGQTYWRMAEILLALIAVTSGLIAWYLRRSSAG